LITVIPLFTEEGQVEYYVGLQIDLVEQPNSILEKMQSKKKKKTKKKTEINNSMNMLITLFVK
jgi:hypothetical protein